MPRYSSIATSADFTLSQFADSGRASKATRNRLTKDWFECDLADFDDDDDNDDTTVTKGAKPRRSRHRHRHHHLFNDGNTVFEWKYPNDVWWLLARYIDVGEIGRFAGICRYTYEMTRSAAFWRIIYARYYRNAQTLPERLQPTGVSRVYGLRSCVIKMLFYCYAPFIRRISQSSPLALKSTIINKLVAMDVCVIETWHESLPPISTSSTPIHMLYVTFAIDNASSVAIKKSSSRGNRLDYLDNVCANLADGHYVLKVKTRRFLMLNSTLKWLLAGISLHLMSDMRSYSLRIDLHRRRRMVDERRSFQIENVDSVQLIPWWSPDFPLDVV